MKMLSIGLPSTLGTWHEMCQAYFGPASAPTMFIKEKMDAQGSDMEVLADESQLLYALNQMYLREAEALGADIRPDRGPGDGNARP